MLVKQILIDVINTPWQCNNVIADVACSVSITCVHVVFIRVHRHLSLGLVCCKDKSSTVVCNIFLNLNGRIVAMMLY